MSRKHHGKDFLFGAMLGSTLGALTAAMLATKKGHKIQDHMIDKYHEFEGMIKSYASGKKRKAKRAISSLTRTVNAKVKKAKKVIRKRVKRRR